MILVVSDDEHLRDEATFAFPTDVEVVLAKESSDAWHVLEERRPDAVVVALRSGNAGGFNLLRAMSQRVDLKDVPSLMLLDRDQDRWLAKQAGATVCRTGPLEAGDLAAETLDLV
jgi:DNA-binding response OmpR family regulator